MAGAESRPGWWGGVWPPRPRDGVFVPLLLVAAVVVVWSGTLHAPFVYDDKIEVVGNPTLRLLSEWSAITTYNLSRPLLIFTYAINWAISGLDPLGYHLTSIGIHALNGMLAWRLLARFLSPGRAGAGAALWALHPMVTEGVTYISGRSDALCATGWLIALAAWTDHLRGEGSGARRLAYGATVAALLTKEVAILLPLGLYLLDRVVVPGGRSGRWRDYAPLLLAMGLAVGVRVGVMGLPRPEVPRGLWAHLCTQAEAWTLYLRLWLVPVGQSILHDGPQEARWQGGLALGAWVAALVWALRRGGWTGALLGLAACWLAPSSVLPLKEVLAEHRSYLAGLALSAAVVAVVPRTGLWWMVAAGLAMATVARNRVWESEVALWADASAKHPESADATYGYGDALRLSHQPGPAEVQFRRVLELRPGDENASINLGITLAEQGHLDEARDVWQGTLRLHPQSCPTHNNLAALDFRAGRLREAAAGYASTLRYCPADPMALYNLGDIYRLIGDTRAAVLWFERYLERVPGGAQTAQVQEILATLR